MIETLRAIGTPLAILAVTAAGLGFGLLTEGYWHFILALVALTTITGVGLNILLGLTGQISLGHVGFYAIGAYTAAILTLNGMSFWLAFPIAGVLAGVVGALLALPALRVTGPYLAMVTIAFAFIVEHGTIEWRDLTGGQNGLMGITPPSVGSMTFTERDIALMAVCCAGLALYFFYRLANSTWGKGMVAVRDAEVAARSTGLNPVIVKTAAFALSAVLTGLAGAMFAPLMMFVAPSNFPFSQSILFLLAVIVGGAGWTLGPVIGAIVSVVFPEMLGWLAEYRLLFFGSLLLVVLWLAPEGVLGSLAKLWRRVDPRTAAGSGVDVATFLKPTSPRDLVVRDVGIAFGGIRAATGVSFDAKPGKVTSVIGPNGAGKTTVLNIVGGFYRPDTGTVKLGDRDLSGASAWKVARAGIARTYQTTKLFTTLSVLDNVLIALRRGELGAPLSSVENTEDVEAAEALLAFVGYSGPLATAAGDLPHVDRRLVEIARALASRPDVLLLDEPAAGLMRSDKDELSALLRQIADIGIAVILVEHDMTLVMGISDHVVVLDAGSVIAQGTAVEVRHNPRVLKAYLGGGDMRDRPRKEAFEPPADAILSVVKLTAGYGAAPVLQAISFDVRPGEMVAMLGANGAGKSTIMRALSGLLRPVSGNIVLDNQPVQSLEAYRIAREGLALVPEGRQVFGELDVRDNLLLGAFSRKDADLDREIEALLNRFPRLRERLTSRAGLLSGGEQQMLAIARGLMANPQLLMLDEPSLGLAPAMINELFDILAELRDEGVTILLVDQMAALALTVADRGYVLEQGRFAREGAAAELAADPALEAAYLGAKEKSVA